MTTEEKLKHFKAAALEEARQESTAAIEEHRRALEKLFQEHTIDKDRQAALEVKTETDRLKRENNITLSKTGRAERNTFCRSTGKTGRLHGNTGIPAASDFTDP